MTASGTAEKRRNTSRNSSFHIRSQQYTVGKLGSKARESVQPQPDKAPIGDIATAYHGRIKEGIQREPAVRNET